MITATREGACLTLTLNRPDQANALNRQMLSGLLDEISAIGDDTHALILTGAGRVFSAGADLSEIADGLATSPLWEELSAAVAGLRCLTITALNGTIAGGAFGMALASDIRIAVPSARFFYPVMAKGILPQPSDVTRLTTLIGPARTKLILMCGAKLTADEAQEFGLIEQQTDQTELMQTAHFLAKDCRNASISHVSAIKDSISPRP